MTAFADGKFITQYAIRGPDGRLLRHTISKSFMKAWLGEAGPSLADDEPWPLVFDSLSEAQEHLDGRKKQAAQLGVNDWDGVIVQRLCSPFTAHDPAAELATQIQDWLDTERPEVTACANCHHPDYEHYDVQVGSPCLIRYGAWGEFFSETEAPGELCECPGFVAEVRA